METKWTCLCLLLMPLVGHVDSIYCDRRPPRATMAATPSKGYFKLDIPQMEGGKYLPDQQYVVKLEAVDPDMHKFTAFMVWPEGQTSADPKYPRKTIHMDAGQMHINENYPTKNSDRCPSTIEMTNAAPTSIVEMYWKSPTKGKGCVTLHAMVAENEEVWYQDGQDLTQVVCEDNSFLDSANLEINTQCSVCEEAKYELTFEGKWSRNTHPHQFPVNDWDVYYGDLVGASHSTDYYIWRDGNVASEAMQRLAEANDTSILEQEILDNFAQGHVRTLIKGKGHGPWNGGMSEPTYALVRVDRNHHLISTATALRPSPDWFLGVSEFELCQTNNTWLTHKVLSFVPWDAGTDNGISFESPDEKTDPKAYVSRVRVGSFDRESPFFNMNYKQLLLKPFATLTIKLIRTYPKICEDLEPGEAGETAAPDGSEAEQPEAPSRRTSPPPQSVENSIESNDNTNGEVPASSDDDCPLSDWEQWTACSSSCGPGYRSRSRYHIVNGVQYRYYKPEERQPDIIIIPSEECEERHKEALLETESCKGPCTEPKNARRIADPQPIRLSHSRQRRTTAGVDGKESRPEGCVVSAWSRWTPCSNSCGEGRQMRARYINKHATNGGTPCPKPLLQFKKCMLTVCQ